MGRPKLPTPLVSAQTVGDVRPLGYPLPELWRLYLASGTAHALSLSRQRQLKRTAELCESLPDFPEQGHVRQWLANMAASRAPSTVTLHKDDLSALFSWALASNFVAYNPLHKMRWRRPEPERHAVLDIWEKWPAMLALGRDARERAFLGVLRFAGLREGEALALRPEHIERWREPWTIRVMRQRGQHSLTDTDRMKTPASKRPVPVHPSLKPLLEPVLAEGAASVKVGRGGQRVERTPYLFPYRANDLARLMVGLRQLFPLDFPAGDAWHVFRHTLAVETYRRGVDVVSISRMLGHVSVRYTQGYLRGFIGDDAVAGVFDGADVAPPWARVIQEPLGLGVLGAVPAKRGGAPPGRTAEKREAPGCSREPLRSSVEVSRPPVERKKAAR